MTRRWRADPLLGIGRTSPCHRQFIVVVVAPLSYTCTSSVLCFRGSTPQVCFGCFSALLAWWCREIQLIPEPPHRHHYQHRRVEPRRDRIIANRTKCHKLPKFFLFVSLSSSSGDMPSACISSPVMVWWTQFGDRGNHYVIKQDGDFVWWGDTCLWQRDLIYYLLERCLTRYNEYQH